MGECPMETYVTGKDLNSIANDTKFDSFYILNLEEVFAEDRSKKFKIYAEVTHRTNKSCTISFTAQYPMNDTLDTWMDGHRFELQITGDKPFHNILPRVARYFNSNERFGRLDSTYSTFSVKVN
ncbi:hypothetical protein D1872_37710 [compost metagenome]